MHSLVALLPPVHQHRQRCMQQHVAPSQARSPTIAAQVVVGFGHEVAALLAALAGIVHIVVCTPLDRLPEREAAEKQKGTLARHLVSQLTSCKCKWYRNLTWELEDGTAVLYIQTTLTLCVAARCRPPAGC